MAEHSSWQILVTRGVHEDVLYRNMIALSASVWLLYEYILTLRQEYKYIWRGSMNTVKIIYLFGRYMGIAAQLANVYFIFGPLSVTPVSRQTCMTWFIYLTSCAMGLLIALDIVLMTRVYILYERKKRIAVGFALLLVAQIILVFTCCKKTLPLVPFGPTCDVLQCPHQVVYLMAGVMITHTILLLMTVAKRKIASGTSPVVHLIVRDGAWVFALVASMWVTIIPYSLFTRISKPHLIFLWPMAFMSVIICRLILNLQIVPRTEDDTMSNSELQFTTCITISEVPTINSIQTSNHLPSSTSSWQTMYQNETSSHVP